MHIESILWGRKRKELVKSSKFPPKNLVPFLQDKSEIIVIVSDHFDARAQPGEGPFVDARLDIVAILPREPLAVQSGGDLAQRGWWLEGCLILVG